MKRFSVEVRHVVIGTYLVEAETAEEAQDNWSEGKFLGYGDEHLSGEPLKAEEVSA